MITWILILTLYAGPLSKGDSISLVSVPGFLNERECIAAGEKADKLVGMTFKKSNFICVIQSKPLEKGVKE